MAARKRIESKKSKDIPVTQRMLFAVRDELKTDSKSLRHDLKGDMESFRGEVRAELTAFRGEMETFRGEVRAELAAFRGEIQQLRHEMDSKFEKVLSEIQRLGSEVHRIGLLVEEQNARNKFVLDGYASLEHRVSALEGAKDI